MVGYLDARMVVWKVGCLEYGMVDWSVDSKVDSMVVAKELVKVEQRVDR